MKKITAILLIAANLIFALPNKSIALEYNQSMENAELNPDLDLTIEKELNKIPASVKNLLIENNVEIMINEGLLEGFNKDLFTYGLYYWESNQIVMDSNASSIEYALIHEVGHALDDILHIRTEGIYTSYFSNEIVYQNEHFNSCIEEYVAQGIHEYYNNTLEKNSIMYKELNQILKGI